MFCQNCGASVRANQFCPNCGTQCIVAQAPVQPVAQPTVVVNNYNAPQGSSQPAQPVQPVRPPVSWGRKKDKWVAFVLCFFFGGFGAHKFYEGRVLTGFIYLFTLGIFGIGTVIDCIVILTHPNPYYVR